MSTTANPRTIGAPGAIPPAIPSEAALKARYRSLVAENHPDRALGRGLPPAAVAIATRRLAAINAAYDRITAERPPG